MILIKQLPLVFRSALIIIFSISAMCEAETSQSASEGELSGAIFNTYKEYVHGFLSVAETYSDNILYTHEDRKSDLISFVSPGIWISIPPGNEDIPETTILSTAPGGIVQDSQLSSGFKRMTSYVTYHPEFQFYRNHSEENSERHHLEGATEIQLRGGLNVGALGMLVTSYDDRSTDNSVEINEYRSRLLRGFIGYEFSPKLRLECVATNFLLDYRDDSNLYRDRTDNTANASVSYLLTPKSRLFLEYEIIVIRYKNRGTENGDEQTLSGGWMWYITDKSTGYIKAGRGVKSKEQGSLADEDYFRTAVLIQHQLTTRTKLSIQAFQRTEESNISWADYRLTRGFTARYKQKLSSKIQVELGSDWWYEMYRGGSAAGFTEKIRKYKFGITSKFRPWLSGGIKYTHSRQNSDFEDSSFTANEILFQLTGSF